MTLSEPYLPSQAAVLLGVSRSTVIRYTDTFELFLPDYSERSVILDAAQRRQYTHQDLCWLSAIIDLHRTQPQGTSRAALLEQMESPEFPPLLIPTLLPNEEADAEDTDDNPPTPEQVDIDPEGEARAEQDEDPRPLATVAHITAETPQLPALVVDMLNQQIRDVRDENTETRRMLEELKARGAGRGSALAYGIVLGIGLSIVLAVVLSLLSG